MTPNRVRRLLVFVGVCAGAVLLTQSSEPSGAAPRHASPWIESDSVRITNAVFSPNADGVQDVVSFALSFTQPSSILVHVRPQGLPDTVATIVDSVPDPRVTFNFEWDGRGDDSQVQPEGNYSVFIRGLAPPDSTGPVLPDSTLFFIQRQVRLDVTAPRVEILEVDPADYAPDTEHIGVVPEVLLRVSQSQLEDSVQVVLTDSMRVTQTLPLAGGFSGDGDYSAPCHDCSLPTFLDGPLYITATAHDVAGNQSDSSFAVLDKNIAPPEFEIERPNTRDPNEDPAGRFHFQFADSLVGKARDRQFVDSVTVAFLPDTKAIFVPPRDGSPDTLYRFFVDLSQTLTDEGAYELELGARDIAGVASTQRLTIVIDRTPDAPPTIIPRPPRVTKLQVLQFTIAADDSAIRRVIIKGGVGPPDTLGMSAPQRAWQRTLNPGPNLMSFESMDYARNISVADTMTVVWETSEGLVAPERFLLGQSIQVDVGDSPAQSVSVRILALDGSLVRTFEDAASRLVYTFRWDLTTPEGRPVRNGGYLIWAQVRYPNGNERRFRRMTAVVR